MLSFATGIQDAIAYPDFSCFASNQTGNTIILAIGARYLVTSFIKPRGRHQRGHFSLLFCRRNLDSGPSR